MSTRETVQAAWAVRAHLSAETGPSVVAYPLLTVGLPLTPDEARELGLMLWDAADEAEGRQPGGST